MTHCDRLWQKPAARRPDPAADASIVRRGGEGNSYLSLNERNRTGRGQAIDVSMTDCLFSLVIDEPLDCYAQLGLSSR